jgi:hypothetical protein
MQSGPPIPGLFNAHKSGQSTVSGPRHHYRLPDQRGDVADYRRGFEGKDSDLVANR